MVQLDLAGMLAELPLVLEEKREFQEIGAQVEHRLVQGITGILKTINTTVIAILFSSFPCRTSDESAPSSFLLRVLGTSLRLRLNSMKTLWKMWLLCSL